MQNIAKVGKSYVLFISRLKQPLIPRVAAGGLSYRHAYQQEAGTIAVTFQSSSFLTYLINSLTT